MPTFEHKGLGVSATVPDDLRHRDVEAFYKARREFSGGEGGLSSPEQCGNIVRAAAKLGWIDDLDVEGIDGLKTAAVIFLSGKVQGEVVGTMRIPPE